MKNVWQRKSVGEILQLRYGKPLDDSDRKPNGRFPVYGANGEKDRTDKFYYDKPSIIVGRKGSAGEINLTEPKFWPLDVSYFVIFDEHEHDLRFLYYLLTTLELTKLAKGVKPGINRNEVYSLITQIPPLPEQQRIVGILDEAFEGIATAKTSAEKNLQNARAIFESHLQSVFAKRGKGWEDRVLGELANFRNGINYTKTSRGEQVKIVGVKDFQNYFWMPLENLDTVTLDGKLDDFDRLKSGDILSVRSNGNPELIGRCILAKDVPERISHFGFTIRIRLANREMLPEYLCHFMKCGSTREHLTESGKGTNIKSLNQQILGALKIPFPPVLEQKQIVAEIDGLSEETQLLASLYERKLAALDALKKSLLNEAFTGKL